MTAAEVSLFAFAACNALRVAAYVPQMVKLYSHPGAAAAFSHSSWWLFAAANASTAAYGQFVVGDAVLAALSAFSAACCATLIGIAHWRRRRPFVAPVSALGEAGSAQVSQERRGPGLHTQRGDALADALDTSKGGRPQCGNEACSLQFTTEASSRNGRSEVTGREGRVGCDALCGVAQRVGVTVQHGRRTRLAPVPDGPQRFARTQ